MLLFRVYAFLFLSFNCFYFTTSEIKYTGWWKNSIFYQIFPLSFMDSDGDGSGDLKGIISKLDHFVDLGIGVIWMNPIYTSPLIDIGYDISDYYNIDKTFGSIDDFEELIRKANELGIRVIMDFVPNHTSDQHEWFNKSVNGIGKYKDYYIWREGRENNTKPPNNWNSFFYDVAWRYNEKRDLWYLHQFEYREIDLNFTNSDVHEEMDEILRFWLDKGVHGFRIDAPVYLYEDDQFRDEPLTHIAGLNATDRNYLNHIYTISDPRDFDAVARWRKVLDDWTDSHNEEERIMLTEVYKTGLDYYKYGSNIPFNFNFITVLNETSTTNEFKNVIDSWMAAVPPDGVANWVTTNHDLKRCTAWYPKRPDILIMLVMILPGVACVYYGDEIAMEENYDITWGDSQDANACHTNPQMYKQVSRDPLRTPFQWDNTTNANFSAAKKPWLPIHKNYKTLNLKNQKSEPNSPYNLFKTLSKLKKSSEILKSGSLTTDVLNNDTLLVVSRQLSNEGIVLLINFSDNSKQNVDASSYLPGSVNATVVVSSRGSGIQWGSSVSVSNVELPPAVLLILTNSKEVLI